MCGPALSPDSVKFIRLTPEWSKVSWRDIVVRKRRYFHPYGGSGWPTTPPNYLGFRYDGQLQSIHHVERYEVVTDMHSRIRDIAPGQLDPHVLYYLGLPIVPAREVRMGRIWPSGRVWAAIDALLTCKTVSQARDITNRRLAREQ